MFGRSFLRFASAAIVTSGLLIPVTSCTSSGQLGKIVISPSSFTTTLVVLPDGSSAPEIDQTWTQFKAIGYYGNANNYTTQDITDQVTWTSYTPLLVTIGSSGSNAGIAQVTGWGTGFTQITAAMPGYGGLITSNAATFTVNPPSSVASTDVKSIAITPASITVDPGAVTGFSAIGTTGTGDTINITTLSTWSSTVTSVATIGANNGQSTAGNTAGSTAIICTYTNSDGTEVTASATLTVN